MPPKKIVNQPLDMKLYEKVKKKVYAIYEKPSAFRSGAVVKMYKELGGKYSGERAKGTLTRWFKEEWKDVNPEKSASSYPVFRPTKRITKNTPLTVDEVDKRNLRKQSRLKQKIKGKHNLKPFKGKK
jgi:hypothetical protein